MHRLQPGQTKLLQKGAEMGNPSSSSSPRLRLLREALTNSSCRLPQHPLAQSLLANNTWVHPRLYTPES